VSDWYKLFYSFVFFYSNKKNLNISWWTMYAFQQYWRPVGAIRQNLRQTVDEARTVFRGHVYRMVAVQNRMQNQDEHGECCNCLQAVFFFPIYNSTTTSHSLFIICSLSWLPDGPFPRRCFAVWYSVSIKWIYIRSRQPRTLRWVTLCGPCAYRGQWSLALPDTEVSRNF